LKVDGEDADGARLSGVNLATAKLGVVLGDKAHKEAVI
jgi:hypothetical protein